MWSNQGWSAHIFGTYPFIQPFWTDIQAATKMILVFEVEFSCLSFYLGNISEDLNTCDKYLLKILMVAGKKVITRCWLHSEPPTLNQWRDIVKNIYSMEQITFVLRLQKQRGEEYWKKWNTYPAKIESDD